MSDSLPLPPVDTRFTLGDRITPVQERFLEVHGFLHFEGVLNLDEVAVIKSELAQVESQWVDEGRTRVHGIPIFYGRRADGRRFVQRFAFASLFSKRLSEIIQKPRFRALLPLVQSGFSSHANLEALKQGQPVSFRGIAGAYHAFPARAGLAPYSRELGWMAWYKGKVLPPKPGRYRFWGYADNHLLVAINGNAVFEGSRHNSFKTLNIPRSDNPSYRQTS